MSLTKYRTATGASRWRVTWRLPDGRSRSKAFGTLREARAFEAEAITARTRGVVFDPRRGDTFTVAAVYASWLATRQDVTPKVRRGFTDNWRLHVAPAFGTWPVTKVDRESIQEWVNAMDCSPRTKRWRHSLLRMILAHAVLEGLLVKNPAERTVFPPLDLAEHLYLTHAEVDELAIRCRAQGDIVRILAYTGLRWGELTGLNVADVDLVRRRISVRRSMTQVGGTLTTGKPKSRAGIRTVPLPRSLVAVLAARVDGRPRTAPAVTSPRGARLSRENWVRAVRWREQVTALGYPTLRVHDLRHTYASLARAAGADLRLLQVAMGHASITVTAHTYADLFDGELDAVADALDARVVEITEGVPEDP
ncbi:tyrosine-type recombinase/integrase [Gordonia rubripertincta]|uniref:Tyrosine-type recombinase/integrase n=2 Tax=Gordonia rubripertincta TaxID=36822 RepID=A0AAW6RE87_GORRU|nr:site-specific integrase [Gordonia rubripertincta]MDG6782322.1 tyrosine-type recombinase/integrase [Gordonia rubripertincta]NKY64420.1 site-specific integrase [Gordonia rubripertincta]GAB84823.1 putative integrase [Gordonia rubripertincta NBRC 101908]